MSSVTEIQLNKLHVRALFPALQFVCSRAIQNLITFMKSRRIQLCDQSQTVDRKFKMSKLASLPVEPFINSFPISIKLS